jgi:hypothetical protein
MGKLIQDETGISKHQDYEILQAYTIDIPKPLAIPLISALNCNRFQGDIGFNIPHGNGFSSLIQPR